MNFLLDTTVISAARSKQPDRGVRRWFSSVDADRLRLSVLVVGEIQQGIERLRRRDPDQATALDRWLEELRSTYQGRIAPVSLAVGMTWGGLGVTRTIPVVDGLLAATAITHNWTLVTRNERDVADTGVRLLNPFTG